LRQQLAGLGASGAVRDRGGRRPRVLHREGRAGRRAVLPRQLAGRVRLAEAMSGSDCCSRFDRFASLLYIPPPCRPAWSRAMTSLPKVAALALLASLPAAARADEPVAFSREVIPVLSRSGCAAGACHGAVQGKG